MNRIILIGNSSKDAELKTSAGGKSFATFSLAVQRKFAQDEKNAVDWFNCICFGALAEKVVSKYVKKGQKIAISGRLEFTTAEDGKIYHSVVVEDLELCGGKSNSGENSGDNTVLTPVDDDDLPF